MRLERDLTNKSIAGVCSGLAKYLQVEVSWVRLFFIVATLFWGFGLLAYIVLLIVMPLPGQPAPSGDMGEVGKQLGDAVNAAGQQLQNVIGPQRDTEERRSWAGWLLVGIGLLFLVGNTGLLRGFEGKILWPLVVIAFGIWLLIRRAR